MQAYMFSSKAAGPKPKEAHHTVNAFSLIAAIVQDRDVVFASPQSKQLAVVWPAHVQVQGQVHSLKITLNCTQQFAR